jgi:hypothetical protein
MAKRNNWSKKFMEHAGSVEGPADLSSRRGFSRVAENKDEDKPSPKSLREKTLRAASLP